jgi:hypothetical protein
MAHLAGISWPACRRPAPQVFLATADRSPTNARRNNRYPKPRVSPHLHRAWGHMPRMQRLKM